MIFENSYFIIGNAYAGKSTMARLLAEKHKGILCGENRHDPYPGRLDPKEFSGRMAMRRPPCSGKARDGRYYGSGCDFTQSDEKMKRRGDNGNQRAGQSVF